PAPFLLILVPSAPSHLEQRLAVRDTWGGPWQGSETPKTRTIFVLGIPPEPPAQRELLLESRQHRDMLQGDFGDSYANLTLKTLLLLRWARSCCGGAEFVLKADDDVVHWGVAPNRDPRSRHHVPEGLYGAPRFPPYCSGTAYVLSRQAVLAILGAAPGVPRVAPEDVWVGLCARRAGVAA
ncbi:B3GT4 galactosyltransferase, partial [Pachycephala philippinensis]|nr:B3GT4 galactosyltransferase [Pachycephala philippinensis]